MFLVLLLFGADDTYMQGMQAFDQAEFEKAVPALKQAIANGKLSAAELKKARFSLAQACFYQNHTDCARNQVQKLIDARFSYNKKLLPPDFVAFYESVEESQPAPQQQPRKKPPPVAKREPEPRVAEPSKAPPPSAPIEIKTAPVAAETPSSNEPGWYLKMLPLGVGHFVQKDKVFGGVFLGAELALIAANIALAIVNERRVQPNGRLPVGSNGMYWAQQSTAIACYGVLVYDIIDSFVFAGKRGAGNQGNTP